MHLIWLYTSIIFFLFFLASIVFIFVFYTKNKFLFNQNTSLSEQSHVLKQENISHLQTIQKLNTTIEMMNKQDNVYKQQCASFENIAQKSIMQLGSDLNKQILHMHSHHSKIAQERSEANIKTTTSTISSQLEQISKSANSIEKEVQKSSNTIGDLKRSLLSSATVGSFTEVTLQNILLASGLQKNIDFFLQMSIEFNKKIYRPDALIRLTDDNFIIIDAKSSKFFVQSEDSKEQQQPSEDLTISNANNNLIKSMYLHLKNLSAKEYQLSVMEYLKKNNLPCKSITTFMFLYSESFIEKINNIDSGFKDKAWGLNILPVGPTGLMTALSIVKAQSNQHKQMKNYHHIISEIKNLLNSIHILVEHGNKLGSCIYSLSANYDKFAASFNHNILSKTNKVADLGLINDKNQQTQMLPRYTLSVSNTKIMKLNVNDNIKDTLSEDSLNIAQK